MFDPNQFDYQYPEQLIAQEPIEPRDHCRLLVLNRETSEIRHHIFRDLAEILDEHVLLVRNNTRVLPARLFGKKDTGGKCEVLLVRPQPRTSFAHTAPIVSWECLTKPGLRLGQTVFFSDNVTATVRTEVNESDQEKYTRILDFHCSEQDFSKFVETQGHTPLPPYIAHNTDSETQLRQKYQTTYAKAVGSVAAPTAGLHFTPKLDQALHQRGIEIAEVTLHVGLGTFLPVQPEQLEHKRLHQEFFELSSAVANQINQAKRAGKKIIAVGTTTTRVLESCAQQTQDGDCVVAHAGSTELFIQPGDRFAIVDGLITNFHVPTSSLLMLVSAFTCAPNTSHPFVDFLHTPVGQAYQAAIAQQYRLFSFGDAMLITG